MSKRAAPRAFTASIIREGKWFVAQCLEIDVASQGRTEKSAIKNLAEALSLHFAAPRATAVPKIRAIEISPRAA